MWPAVAFPEPLAEGLWLSTPPALPWGQLAPCLSTVNGLQTHPANAVGLSITATVSSRGDETGRRRAGSGSALLMRSCLLLKSSIFCRNVHSRRCRQAVALLRDTN